MFQPYPTYSMAILWNMDARVLHRNAVLGSPVCIPLDGDALARSANRAMQTRTEWQTLRADLLDRLRTNAADADKVNPR